MLRCCVASQFLSGISCVFEIACCAVARLFSAFSVFVFFNSEFETTCCAVAWHLSFLLEYHTSLKMPVALLHGYSQLFQFFVFFVNSEFETACCAVAWHLSFLVEYHTSSRMPVALLRGSSQLFQFFFVLF